MQLHLRSSKVAAETEIEADATVAVIEVVETGIEVDVADLTATEATATIEEIEASGMTEVTAASAVTGIATIARRKPS